MTIVLAKRLLARFLGSATALLMLLAMAAGCGGDSDSDNSSTSTPAPSDAAETPTPLPGTPAPPDPTLAIERFEEFVDYVEDQDPESAWDLYIASVPGDLTNYNDTLGCAFGIFGNESVKMKHMFDRIAPFTVEETFGAAAGSLQIEIKLTGQDDQEYLATLIREPADAPYRLRFFNNGRPATVPGAPDPFPSPEDPQGYCGIWTGPR